MLVRFCRCIFALWSRVRVRESARMPGMSLSWISSHFLVEGAFLDGEGRRGGKRRRLCPPNARASGSTSAEGGENNSARPFPSGDKDAPQFFVHRHRCFLETVWLLFFRKLRECYTEEATSIAYFCLFVLFWCCLPGPANSILPLPAFLLLPAWDGQFIIILCILSIYLYTGDKWNDKCEHRSSPPPMHIWSISGDWRDGKWISDWETAPGERDSQISTGNGGKYPQESVTCRSITSWSNQKRADAAPGIEPRPKN